MGLVNGLRIVLLPPTSTFIHPAGESVCPDAIGWIKKDGNRDGLLSCETNELNIGYIKKVLLTTGELLKEGNWMIEKILSIKPEDSGNGNIAAINVNLRKIGEAEKHDAVAAETSFLSVLSLFQK